MSTQVLCLFKNWPFFFFFCLFFWWILRVVYILETRSLLDKWFASIFSISQIVLTFLISVLWCTQGFNFGEIHFIYFQFCCSYSWYYKNLLPNLGSWRFIPISLWFFFPRVLCLWCTILFVYGVEIRVRLNFSLHVYIQCIIMICSRYYSFPTE